MIFVGYSGRDASIMEALNTVLDSPSPFLKRTVVLKTTYQCHEAAGATGETAR